MPERTLRSYEHRIVSHILTLVKVLSGDAKESVRDKHERRWGPTANMSEICSYLSINIMADVIFVAQRSLLEKPRFGCIVDEIKKSKSCNC